jgi:exodeoxyribonuclease III
LGRKVAGEVEGPYTWWSWRGQAFDNNAGWRIDYHVANSALAPHCADVVVGRANSYAQRWSDHAPVTAHFNL